MVDRGVVLAGCLAGLVGGVPSTVHALVTGRDPLAATQAAGSLGRVPDDRRVCAGIAVHAAMSVGWAVALVPLLRRSRHAVVSGAVLGAGVAAVDLSVARHRFPEVAALPRWPQVVDHLVYGATLGAVVTVRAPKEVG